MLPTPSTELAAIARKLADELDTYAEGLDSLLERRWDPELYRRLAEQFDRMELFAQALPKLTPGWRELLITRVELTHAMWALRSPNGINGRVLSLHARHDEVIGDLRGKCLRYFMDEPAPQVGRVTRH
jgi:hypothetical protein